MDNSKIDINTLEKLVSSSSNLFFAVMNNASNDKFYYTSNVKEILGYSPKEISDMPEKHYSLIVKDDAENIIKSLSEFEINKSLNSLELTYRLNSKSGKCIWFKETLTVNRNGNGEIQESTSAVLNISSIKENEAETQKQLNLLKEQNASKDKFISIVSHDLRAPFTTLLGFSEILINESDITKEEKTEYLQYIYDSSKSQLDYINCLLDWSRLQTGRVKVEPTRLNVKTTIANAITPLTHNAVRKNIDIKMDINPDLHINADERLIGQAIVHLTNNAIKFSPKGKTIYISSSRFKEGMIEIVVRDNGTGISEENQSKLFRIDQKLVLEGTAGEKGSGMGLTLTKEIVEKHGGNIWLYSQPGEGSEFHITIPEAKNIVLIVEDEESILALYSKNIEKRLPYFEVHGAKNGYEAIGMIRELLPTIIITDHDMPLMDGIQLVEAMNKRESGRNIPVIVISAKIDDDIKRAYLKLGVDKIISKPPDLDRLIDIMKECLFLS